jgi:hypothetical protein
MASIEDTSAGFATVVVGVSTVIGFGIGVGVGIGFCRSCDIAEKVKQTTKSVSKQIFQAIFIIALFLLV